MPARLVLRYAPRSPILTRIADAPAEMAFSERRRVSRRLMSRTNASPPPREASLSNEGRSAHVQELLDAGNKEIHARQDAWARKDSQSILPEGLWGSGRLMSSDVIAPAARARRRSRRRRFPPSDQMPSMRGGYPKWKDRGVREARRPGRQRR